VKLTKLGLDIDTDYCIENMKEILQAAKDKQNFVNIDMEDYSRYEKTLSVLKTLRKEYDNVGTVLQGYLRRGLDDLDSLAGVPLRIVKGAYQEKEEVAFKDKHEIDANYFLMIQKHLQQQGFTAIGTHDHRIINAVKLFVKDQGIDYDTFEFQMLYGFRTELQLQLVQEGYNVRVYVPFGKEWYGYFMRRLAERPQNLVSVAKGIITK
jgi:proline dehydrogenase